jgi:hypothetical protein
VSFKDLRVFPGQRPSNEIVDLGPIQRCPGQR